MSSEYRIEKIRRRVTVTLAGGRTLDGEIFLQPSARYHAGPQEPAELLNEPEAFFPLAVGDEPPYLVAKDQVVLVQYRGEAADTEIDGVPDAAIEVVCAGGTTVAGSLRLETRVDRSRLLDFLNSLSDRFVPIALPDGTAVVNRQHVAFVRHRR